MIQNNRVSKGRKRIDSGSALQRYKTWNALKQAILSRYCLAQGSNKRSKGARHMCLCSGLLRDSDTRWVADALTTCCQSVTAFMRSFKMTTLSTDGATHFQRYLDNTSALWQKPFVSGFFRINTFWEKVVTHSVCLFIIIFFQNQPFKSRVTLKMTSDLNELHRALNTKYCSE